MKLGPVVIDLRSVQRYPNWYHSHGDKMYLHQLDKGKGVLDIGSHAASIRIQKASNVIQGVKGWFVDWIIIFYRQYETEVRGRVKFEDNDLASAFGFSQYKGLFPLPQDPQDCSNRGKYIRSGPYVNIPHPGTGRDGDPNVSLCLDEEIVDAVRELLEAE